MKRAAWILIVFSLFTTSQAAVPATMNVQGRVTVDGTNFTGTGQFKFALLGYSDAETRQATATAVLTGTFVTSVNVDDGGLGYESAPTVIFEGGEGSGAAATATVSGGQVTGIEVASAGAGYASPPLVVIDPPPAPPVFETLWSNDGTGVDGGEPSASISIAVNKGLYSVQLGDEAVAGMAALPATTFENDAAFLRTWFSDGLNGFSVLSPDQKIASVPYAMQAEQARRVAPGAITADMLAPGSVTETTLAAGAVTASTLASGAVTTASIAQGAVGSNQINWAQMPTSASASWTFAEGTNVTLLSGQWIRITNSDITRVNLPGAIPHDFCARIEGGKWYIPITGSTLDPLLAANPFANQRWSSVSSSSNGFKLVASVWGGAIFTSTNGGIEWTKKENERNWSAVASSADGTKLFAAVNGGQLYTSTDSGINWTACESNRLWYGLASSEDGNKILAGVQHEQLYTSTDGGANWTPRKSGADWNALASSADGNKLVAGGWNGQLYTSMDSGTNWTARESSRQWDSAASSYDGTKLVAVASGVKIYTSADSGATWTARENNRSWVAVASSYDGTKLVAAVYGGQLYTSTDSGENWVARESSRNWSSVASSWDGIRLIAAVDGGQLYTSTDSGQSWGPCYCPSVMNYQVGRFVYVPSIYDLFGTESGQLRIYGPVQYGYGYAMNRRESEERMAGYLTSQDYAASKSDDTAKAKRVFFSSRWRQARNSGS